MAWLLLVCVPADALFEAGAAKIDITPPEGVPLNGYFDRMGRGNVGAHDPISVRCLYLDDGETNLFLLSADLCMISRELRQRVVELAPTMVPAERIILTATHNHTGTGGMVKSLMVRTISGRYMPEILDMTAQAFVAAMQQAYDTRKRAAVGYGTADQQVLSTNRRVDGGPIDPQIGVLRVDDSDGNAIAILANFAAHPTSVPEADALHVSADYPGFFYTELEKLTNPGCVPMFLNGAEGNQTCANPEKKEDWARTESIGRLLAIRTKEAANSITPKIATLHVGYATPPLPLTLASGFLPSDTILQTLEIDDLLMTFVPGEPCVEIGLELRRQSLQRGYRAQFTVGLSNDYLGYFVPRSLYGQLTYESGMNFYGPGIERWYYREFGAMMARGTAAAVTDEVPAAVTQPVGVAQHVVLEGNNHSMGVQRGQLFRDAIHQAFREAVITPVEAKEILPAALPFTWLPSFIDSTVLALPMHGIGARPLLANLSDAAFDELEGMAEGAELPFDALWLVQTAGVFAERADSADRYRTPFCTMAAVTGERAGAEDVLVARCMDWPRPEEPVIVEARPADGHAFVHVGFAWNAGAFTGMNDAGIVACAERVETLGEPAIDTPPVELVLRGLLQSAGTLEEAQAALAAHPALRGYHVLLAGPGEDEAVLIELGGHAVTRAAVDGLLLGQDTASPIEDDDARTRYGRLVQLLQDERIVGVSELQSALGDAQQGVSGRARILNENTRHAVVFEPKTRRMHVAFPDGSGALTFHTLTVGDAHG